MSLAHGAVFDQSSTKAADLRVRMFLRRDEVYVKAGKLHAVLFSGGAKRILFSERPDWEKTIRIAFRRLPHHIEFGRINQDSYRNYDIVVPLSLPALEDAQRCSTGQRSALPLPSAEAVRLCDDKYEFSRAMINAGFGRYIPPMRQELGLAYPYILKKRIGAWGKNCYIIHNSNDEQRHLELISNPDYYCQELVAGETEFATHILFVGGKIVKALNIRYEFDIDSPIKGQNAPLLQVVCRCRYLDTWAKMLRTVKFEGLCCVNYKVAHGRPFLLEINPRFGGSLAPYFFSFIKHLHA